MTNQEIVAKLWNLCNVLRDDGITYHQYVTELTYILFLKMAKETETEDKIPEKYRWDRLVEKDGLVLKKFYEELLRESPILTTLTGIQQRKKVLGIFTKDCWKRMRMRRSLELVSILPLEYLLM